MSKTGSRKSRTLSTGRFGVPDKFTPPSNRGVSRRAVPCPDCKAQVGWPCHNPDGASRTTVHQSRKRMATRHYLQQLKENKMKTYAVTVSTKTEITLFVEARTSEEARLTVQSKDGFNKAAKYQDALPFPRKYDGRSMKIARVDEVDDGKK